MNERTALGPYDSAFWFFCSQGINLYTEPDLAPLKERFDVHALLTAIGHGEHTVIPILRDCLWEIDPKAGDWLHLWATSLDEWTRRNTPQPPAHSKSGGAERVLAGYRLAFRALNRVFKMNWTEYPHPLILNPAKGSRYPLADDSFERSMPFLNPEANHGQNPDHPIHQEHPEKETQKGQQPRGC